MRAMVSPRAPRVGWSRLSFPGAVQKQTHVPAVTGSCKAAGGRWPAPSRPQKEHFDLITRKVVTLDFAFSSGRQGTRAAMDGEARRVQGTGRNSRHRLWADTARNSAKVLGRVIPFTRRR